MTERGRNAVQIGGLAVAGLLIPLAIAFAHDVRSEIQALRVDVTTELRLTRGILSANIEQSHERHREMEHRITAVEVRLANVVRGE